MDTPHLDYDTWTGRTAVDRDGGKIGKISDIYYDDVTGRPEWVEVKAGLFKGTRLVPLAGARVERAVDDDDDDDADERLVLAYDEERVKDAPDMDTSDNALDPEQEKELYRYYGFNWADRSTGNFGYGTDWAKPRFDADYPKREVGAIGNVGLEGQTRGRVEAEATIHNQEAQVVESTEKVRLRKIERTEMVPVTKEEVVVERTSNDRPGSVQR